MKVYEVVTEEFGETKKYNVLSKSIEYAIDTLKCNFDYFCVDDVKSIDLICDDVYIPIEKDVK